MRRDEVPPDADVYVGWAGPKLLRETDVGPQSWRCGYFSRRREGGYWRCGNRGGHDGFCRFHLHGRKVPQLSTRRLAAGEPE